MEEIKKIYKGITSSFPEAKNNQNLFIEKFVQDFSEKFYINSDAMELLVKYDPNLEPVIDLIKNLDLTIPEMVYLINSTLGLSLFNLATTKN